MSQPLRVTESPLDRVVPPSPSTRSSGPVIGIDVGTSFCRVGVMHQGRAVLVQDGPRPAAIPAFVGLSPQGRILVGQAAQRQLVSEPVHTVFGIKRLLAPYRSSAGKAIRQQLRCALFSGDDGQSWVQLGDRVFAPKELLALLLCQARDLAQNFLGQPVYRAALALPPGDDEDVHQALQEAVATAGLHLAMAVPEPVAAVLAHRRPEDGPSRTLLAYDWGGGGFRASLLRASDEGYELLASEDDPTLGGAGLDQQLLGHVLAGLPERAELLSDENAASIARIVDALERAKHLLSDRPEARVRVPFILPSSAQPRDLDVQLARAELEALAAPLVQRSLEICQRVLDRRQLYVFDVDEVLLMGGQSRMPVVLSRLRELFPTVPIRAEAPEEVIAIGAALAGARA